MGLVSDSIRSSSRMGTTWGFVVMLLGMLAIMAPFISGVAVASFVGLLLIAAGLTITMYCFKAGSFGKGLLQFLFGGITILAGVAIFLRPMLGAFTLAGVLMVYFLIDGIFGIISGFRLKPVEGWGWIVFSGGTSIVLAGLLYYDWPASGAYAVGLLVGIRLIMHGWSIAMLGAVGDTVGEAVGQVGDEIREAAASEE